MLCNKIVIGKLAISICIADKEKLSTFREYTQGLNEDWYTFIFNVHAAYRPWALAGDQVCSNSKEK